MKIIICIGSSCHLKGSRQVVEQLDDLISENKLKDKIELAGAFCIGDCKKGVCIKIEDEQFSVLPENTKEFFNLEVLTRV